MNHICIKPILKCNYNCPTCSARQQLHSELNKTAYIPLSIEEYDTIFNDLYILNNKCRSNIKISISGGEPLLYNNIIELVLTAKKYTDNVIIDTNASMLNKQMIDDLISAGIKTFYVSFMDTNVEQYNNARGIKISSEKFDDIKNNLLYLNGIINKNSPPPELQLQAKNIIVLTKNRLININKIIMMSKFLGFKELSLDFLEACFVDNTHKPNDESINYFMKNIYNKLDAKYHDVFDYIISVLRLNEYRTEAEDCCVPSNFCIILANGDIHQCNIIEYSHEPIIGNIRDISLYDICNSNKFDDYNTNRSKYCNQCPIKMERTLVL